MLIKQNVLTEDELKKALELQKGSGKKIGEVLVDNGFKRMMQTVLVAKGEKNRITRLCGREGR